MKTKSKAHASASVEAWCWAVFLLSTSIIFLVICNVDFLSKTYIYKTLLCFPLKNQEDFKISDDFFRL